MCLYPREAKNRRYEPTKKNGGIVPICPDNRLRSVPIPCGNCMECRKKRRNEWQVRLSEEIQENKNAKFVTLTFSDEKLKKYEEKVKEGIKGYERENAAVSIAVRKFLERWRKSEGKSVKHCLVTELGHKNTERIHLHGFIWTDKTNDFIARTWRYGNISIGNQKYYVKHIKGGRHGQVIVKEGSGTESYVNEKSVNYITKYINKIDTQHMYYKPKMYISNGIGKAYITSSAAKYNAYKGKATWEKYTRKDGSKLGLPKYYREKLYTDEQRERLWLNKLDDQIKWVDGIKIDVSENMDRYYKLRKEARHKNHRLGYGSNFKDTVREYLENQRRQQLAWCRANGKHPRKTTDPYKELENQKLENPGLIGVLISDAQEIQWDINTKSKEEILQTANEIQKNKWLKNKKLMKTAMEKAINEQRENQYKRTFKNWKEKYKEKLYEENWV